MSTEPTDVRAAGTAFARYVNLSARELERWLATDGASTVAPDVAVDGHAVLALLRTAVADRTAADAERMREAVAWIEAERELRPEGDVTESAWRHRLMCAGHDPLTWTPEPTPAAARAMPGRQAPDPRAG